MNDTNWRDRAACRGMPTNLFFPVGNSGPAREQARTAKKVCHGCPVRQQCLDAALQRGTADTDGIRGGMTIYERRKYHKRPAARQST